MYIVAIAWLYVTVLMAATEPGLVAGLLTFLFYGLLPCALVLWLFGTPQRRRRQLAQENALLLQKELGQPDRSNPQDDQ